MHNDTYNQRAMVVICMEWIPTISEWQGPAYLVIAAGGHVIVPAILAVETAYAPALWLQLLIWLPVTTLSALALLQPTKGAIVGLQWQLGMHGFETSKLRRLVAG